MTAFAILGSATSTSLTSRGRSTTTDLPMPSDRKRVRTGMLEVTLGAGAVSAVGAAGLAAASVVAGADDCGPSAARAGTSCRASANVVESAKARMICDVGLFDLRFISYPSVTSVTLLGWRRRNE